MKVIAKYIEVISHTDIKGNIRPLRFKIINEDKSESIIKIDRVTCMEKEKLAGNLMLVFKCQSVIDGMETPYEIKYELSSCKWMLFKI